MSQNANDLSLDLLRLEALRQEVFSTNDAVADLTEDDDRELALEASAEAIDEYRHAYRCLLRQIIVANKHHKDVLIQLLDEIADTYDSINVTLDLSIFKEILNERCKSIIIFETFRDICLSYLLSIMRPVRVAKEQHASDVNVFTFLMVTFGINPEIRLQNAPKEGSQLLTHAIECHDTGAFVKVLLEMGASPRAFLERGTHKGHSPLYTACHLGNFGAVQLLVEAGMDPKEPLPANCNHPHNTPFHAAVIQGRARIVKYLVEGGYVDIRQKYQNVSAIHHAAASDFKKGSLKIAKCLLAHGADPLEVAKLLPHRFMNAVGICVQNGNFEMFEVLIANREKEAYFTRVRPRFNSKQDVSLEYLAREGNRPEHKNILARLLELKEQFEPEKVQAEMRKKHFEKVRDLISNKNSAELRLHREFLASPEAIGCKKGNHPIHHACDVGNLPSLKILVEELKVDVNATNLRGETPLHLACANNYSHHVAFLVQAGARRDLKDAQGQTALDIAEKRQSELCVAALLDESMTLASVVNGKHDTVFQVLLQRASQEECKNILESIENQDRFVLVARKAKKSLSKAVNDSEPVVTPVQSKPKEPPKVVIRKEPRPNPKTAAVQAKLSLKQMHKKGRLQPSTEIKREIQVVEPAIALRGQIVRVPKPDAQFPTVHGLPHRARIRGVITVEPSHQHSLAETEEILIKSPIALLPTQHSTGLPLRALIRGVITVEPSHEHSLAETEEVSIELPVTYAQCATVQDLPYRALSISLITVEPPHEHNLEVVLITPPVAVLPTLRSADLPPAIDMVLEMPDQGLGFDPDEVALSCTYEPSDISDRFGLELFGFLQQKSRSPKAAGRLRQSILDPLAQPFEPPSRGHSPN